MRARLPNRRENRGAKLGWTDPATGRVHTIHLAVGFDSEPGGADLPVGALAKSGATAGARGIARAREVFVTPATTGGSFLEALLDDASVAVSRALQHGDEIEAMARAMGRHGEMPRVTSGSPSDSAAPPAPPRPGPPGSLLGAALAAAAELEASYNLEAPFDAGARQGAAGRALDCPWPKGSAAATAMTAGWISGWLHAGGRA